MSETNEQRAMQTPVADLLRSVGLFFIEHAAHGAVDHNAFNVTCWQCCSSMNEPKRVSGRAPTSDAPESPAPDRSMACDATVNQFGEPLTRSCTHWNRYSRVLLHVLEGKDARGCVPGGGCQHHAQLLSARQSTLTPPALQLSAERALELASNYGDLGFDLSPPLDSEVACYLRAYAEQQSALDAKQQLIDEQAQLIRVLRDEVTTQEGFAVAACKSRDALDDRIHALTRATIPDLERRLASIAAIARGGK